MNTVKFNPSQPAPNSKRTRAYTPLTAELLRKHLHYSPSSGEFTRIHRAKGANVGEIAGCKRPDGYIIISVCGRQYLAQRLAWLYETGDWPTLDMDHIDGVRDNNKLANLRHVSRSVNLQNLKSAKPNNMHSRLLGVVKNKQRWSARITTGGVGIHLGTFDTPELASDAYINAKKELHSGYAP